MQVNILYDLFSNLSKLFFLSLLWENENQMLNLVSSGCLFTGIGICVQPLYLGEIAPTALRGTTSMGTSVFITGGLLMGQVIGLK